MGNQVMGGNSNSAISAGFAIAGGAIGGAIANDENCDEGALFVRGCTFAYNQALGGSNNVGSFNGSGAAGHGGGGAIYQGGAGTISDSTFIGNQAVGGRGNTAGSGVMLVGTALGGAINNASGFGCAHSIFVSGCTFINNQALGGAGNSSGIFAGAAIGGAILNFQGSTATITNTVLTGNQAVGGAGSPGGNGGNALGAGLASGLPGSASIPAAIMLRGTTITMNIAIGGAPGAGGSAGLGVGGGAYLAAGGAACRDALTSIFANMASTSNDDLFGVLPGCP